MHSDDGHNHEEGGIGMQAAVLHALCKYKTIQLI